MNNLPKVVTQRCLKQDLNLRPADCKPKCLTVAPPCHPLWCGTHALIGQCGHDDEVRNPMLLSGHSITVQLSYSSLSSFAVNRGCC